MNEKDLPLNEFTPADGVIISLSQLPRAQFLELMSSDHPSAKKFRRYSKKEYFYHNASYNSLNDFFKR